MIADEQLVVEVSVITCSYSVRQYSFPQSISTALIPVVTNGCYWCLVKSCEVGLPSSFMINKHDFCELEPKSNSEVRRERSYDVLKILSSPACGNRIFGIACFYWRDDYCNCKNCFQNLCEFVHR